MKHDGNHADYVTTSREYYDQRFGRDEQGQPLTDEELLRLNAIAGTLRSELGDRCGSGELTILDFGCGKGWLSDFLSAYGKVTGVDLSSETVEKARLAYPQVDFQTFDVTDTVIVDRLGRHRFDLIVSSEVVEHVLDQDGYFDNVFSLLKRQGAAFLMTTPNGRWKRNWFYGKRKDWGQPYEFWLTASEIEAKIADRFKQFHLRSFGSPWIEPCKSFGLLNLLGSRYPIKLARLLGCESAYWKFLDRRGVGLYLLLFARR